LEVAQEGNTMRFLWRNYEDDSDERKWNKKWKKVIGIAIKNIFIGIIIADKTKQGEHHDR
jgi:hypothetical protein